MSCRSPQSHETPRPASRFTGRFLPLCRLLALVLLAPPNHVCAQAAPREAWTSNRVIGSPFPPAPYAVQQAFSNLTFHAPVDLVFLPTNNTLLVLEQGGPLYSINTQTNAPKPELVFNFREGRRSFDSAYAIALHPRFAENRFIFVCYAERAGKPDGSVISRFKLFPTTSPRIDPASEQIIIRWPSGGHNGCTLSFGPDGMLYFSTGDAGDPDPPDGKFKTGQDLSDLLACIGRIDVDRPSTTNAYSIPPNNPFLSTPGARPEIWAFGFRNPWRMSFDPASGDLWVGDVGWEQWEMIYRVQRGGNYGWSITEGPNRNVRTDVAPGPGPILPPLAAISHADGASITGGYVYHGRKLPKLRGAYIYGDWETGRFWALRNEGDKLVANDELCDTTLKPVSFAIDAHGELFILDYNGGIHEFVPNAASAATSIFPRHLSETGLFASLNPLQPSSGVVPYSINAPMWNDYAAAELLLAVPGTQSVITADGPPNIAGSTWSFPTNTVLARTLTLEMRRGQPSSKRTIETQLLHWDGQTWNPHTFRWNTNQTDAELVGPGGAHDRFVVQDDSAPGGERVVPWRFMSRAECFRCHNVWGGETLSLNWLQLHRTATNATSVPEWQRLQILGVLRVKNPPRPIPAPLVHPYDEAMPLETRARSWLHANCAGCHRFGAGGAVAMHLNFDKPPREWRALDQKPIRGDFELVGARIIAPGDAHRSALLYRILTEGSGHMPHIGSRLVDERGARLVRNWISSLPVSPSEQALPEVAAAKNLSEALAKQFSDLGAADTLRSVNAFLSSMNGCLMLEGHATNSALREAIAGAASNHTNALVRDFFQRFLPQAQKRAVLGSEIDPKTILSLSGNSRKGKVLFTGASQCSRCHTCEGEGRAFGPDLTGIARRYTPSQTLEHILFPSKLVPPEYKTTVVTLRDGSEVSGFVLRKTPGELILRDETLNERVVKLGEIVESRESSLSAMPEGLLAPLTAEEVADLLAYLHSVGRQ